MIRLPGDILRCFTRIAARRLSRAEEGTATMRRAIIVPAITAALIAWGAPLATAAPPEQETFELVCDGGQTFEVVVNGNGAFTPARVLGSNQVLIPISFGDFTFTAVLPDGTVIEDSEPGGEAKGGGNVAQRNPRPTVTCTFEDSFVLEEDDPEFGLPAGTVVTFGGDVTGFLTGR